MKAIIPVAGVGTRLRPFTYTQPKALIPVAGKPILSYIIEDLKNVGVSEFVFIIGYLGDKIIDFVENNYPEISSVYIQQLQREGLGHAVSLVKDEVKPNEEIIILLGDCIIEADFESIVHTSNSCLGVKKVEDPTKFGVAELDINGSIKTVVEKPAMPKSNMALVGIYRIKESAILFEGLDYNIQHNIRTNGEFQLTDGIMYMLNKGVKIDAHLVENWSDVGQGEVLLDTNAKLLKKYGNKIAASVIQENSIIVPPVNIAENSIIKNSIIGPNVTIGEGATIENSMIKESIIGSYTHLKEMLLNRSVIGSDAALTGLSQRLNIGDNTELDFSR